MKQPYKLVRSQVSHDSVAVLKNLLEQAEQGELIGVAFAAMYKEGNYVVDLTGEAHRSPTFARGMVKALDDCLRHLVHRP